MIRAGVILVFILVTLPCFTQQIDTLQADTLYQHNKKRAALLSTFIPGSGQIYNEIGYRKFAGKKHRAWWKTPIIYGGLGACAYFFYENNKYAALLKQEYKYRKRQPVPDDTELFYDKRFVDYNSTSALINGYEIGDKKFLGFDAYSKRRDYFLIGFLGIWVLNIVEAYVDAHFVTFDVTEDLTFSWSPSLMQGGTPGLSLQLSFNN